jgi:hypothetical protein
MDAVFPTLRRIWPISAEPGWASLVTMAGCLMLAMPILQTQLSIDWRADVDADRLAAAMASDVDRDMGRFDLLLQTVMAGERSPESKDLSPNDRNALLSSRVPRDPNISFLDVLDADGGVLATLQPERPASNWSRQDYFALQRDNTAGVLIVGQPFSLTHEDAVGFTISRRITDSDNMFTGVAVLGIRVASFLDQFSSHDLGGAESVTLLDSRGGRVLMRMPFDVREIGHPVEPLGPFHAFMRSEPPPYTARNRADGNRTDHAEQRFVFHRVGKLPLVVMVATRVPDRDSALLRWSLPGLAAVGFGSIMLLHRARRAQPARSANWP